MYRLCKMPGLRQMGLLERLPLSVRTVAQNRDARFQTQAASPAYMDWLMRLTDCPQREELFFPEGALSGVKDWQRRRMLLDMRTYLPDDILCKVDRASMRISLEARCPILDRAVMEYSFRLPQPFLYRKGEKKRILKEIAYEYVPRELLDRPKTGFSPPLDAWLRGPLAEELADCVSRDSLRRQGLFNPEAAAQLVGDYLKTGDRGAGSGANFSRLVWAFFVFQKWYRRWMA